MAERKGSVRDLQQVIREVQIAQAERDDVVVALRETERARLEILAEALDGVFDSLDDRQNEFALAILPTQPPRFWVDSTTFVLLGRDRRTYRLVKETRLGRNVILETTDVETIADAVTRYVAERIVEKNRALEAEWVPNPDLTEPASSSAVKNPNTGIFDSGYRRTAPRDQMRGVFWAAAGFGFGVLAGIFLLLVYAWVAVG